MNSPSIASRRKQAAEASGGISADYIYTSIERAVVERELRGRVLDYGAGTGNLTRNLLKLERFSVVAAADIMEVPVDLGGKVEWMAQDLNLPLARNDGEFDVVVASEVIEHLENPRFMVRELYRLLLPGGTAIISTPNNESWRSILALVARGHFVSFSDSCYPAHITALVRKDLSRIFVEAGFNAPEFRYTNHGSIPAKPDFTWQGASFGLLRGLRFSDNLLAIAEKPR